MNIQECTDAIRTKVGDNSGLNAVLKFDCGADGVAYIDGKSTRVTLHHTGWGDGGEWDQTYAYFDRAWGNVLGNLKKRFETGPQDWTDWMARLRKFHEQPPAAKP